MTRRPADIRVEDCTLADVLADSAGYPWRYGSKRADLRGATGNMREVRSAQLDRWPLVWTRNPEGVTTLWIGCQGHDLDKWERGADRWIEAMDPDALDWWRANKARVLDLVRAYPATPYGAAKAEVAS